MEFPYGTIVTAPPCFVPPEQWPEYATISDPVPLAQREVVGTNPAGSRWGLWPLIFEEYFTDKDPDLQESKKGRLAYNRLVRWKRVARTDIPPGWWAPSRDSWRVDGFQKVEPGDYTARWHKNARRDLRLWREQHAHKYSIEPVSLAEYAAAYRTSIIARRVSTDRLDDLERKLTYPIARAHTTLWGVRNRETHKIVAGTALIHSPTYRASTHFSPFILTEGARIFAATALTDHWLGEAQRRGDIFVMTANFWFSGLNKKWQGFSEFKSHFGWEYHAYPPMLMRFVPGKLL